MTIRFRLAALLVAVIGASLLAAWMVTEQVVLAPLSQEVLRGRMGQSVQAAVRLEQGEDPRAVASDLELSVELRERAPPSGQRWVRRRYRGREILILPGPKTVVAVPLADGHTAIVTHHSEALAPRWRGAASFGLVAFCVALLAIWVAVAATRPLRATTAAMQRIAEGQLNHRLDETGSAELVELARAFNAMADRVESMLRSEQQLMAGVSHELRTPMTRLRLHTELLRDGGGDTKRLDGMEAALEDMDRLLSELLEISRLEIGDRVLELVPVELSTVVERARQRHPLPDHGIVVEGESHQVLADPARLERVLGNLLQNAGKYAPPGSTVWITLGRTTVEVRDEGPGVPEADLPQLFEPFFRGQAARKQKPGVGLGLMLAQLIVRLHGGTVSARNHPAGGLLVRIDLSAAQDVEQPLA